MTGRRLALFLWLGLSACAEGLPPDIVDYESWCLRMNQVEIPPVADDPHDGYKTVYACHATAQELAARTYPEGTIIVKESRKAAQTYPFLVATARKVEGAWSWAEYTRNFDSEAFLKLPVAEAVCVECHQARGGGEPDDWILTVFEGGAE